MCTTERHEIRSANTSHWFGSGGAIAPPSSQFTLMPGYIMNQKQQNLGDYRDVGIILLIACSECYEVSSRWTIIHFECIDARNPVGAVGGLPHLEKLHLLHRASVASRVRRLVRFPLRPNTVYICIPPLVGLVPPLYLYIYVSVAF